MGGFQFDDLSAAERQLWEAFPRGGLVDLRTGPSDGPEHAAAWGGERRVRAAVLAALLAGADPADARPTSCLRLAGA
jgi:hypothetical protein